MPPGRGGRRPGSARSGVPARRSSRVLGALLAVPCALACAAWVLGEVLRDRWTWEQWMFWVPAWCIALAAIAGGMACARLLRGAPVARRGAWAFAAVGVCAAARFAWTDVGWMPGVPAAQPGEVVLTHWNPQWPGEAAPAYGAALAPVLGDVAVISNPGSMTNLAVRRGWIPEGWHAASAGMVAVVTRLPILECRLLANQPLEGAGQAWLAWIVVRTPSGRALSILAADMPSSPRIARGLVAQDVRRLIARVGLPGAPDVVVGDLNSTPGSLVIDAIAPGMAAAPPWRSAGWMCSYRRPWPLLRIDAMLAAPAIGWRSYRTIDLGFSDHRAQQGVLAIDAAPSTPPADPPHR